jgi:hypothetical protein
MLGADNFKSMLEKTKNEDLSESEVEVVDEMILLLDGLKGVGQGGANPKDLMGRINKIMEKAENNMNNIKKGT